MSSKAMTPERIAAIRGGVERMIELCDSHEELCRQRDEAVAALRRIAMRSCPIAGHKGAAAQCCGVEVARAFLAEFDGKDDANV